MRSDPSLAVRLFGTEEPVAPPRLLKAGALTAEFDAGNLRHIRFGGVEIIRAISFIVRDRNWGTYGPALEDLVVEERADGFGLSYDAVASDGEQTFRFSARIAGDADGRLDFSAAGRAETDFLTNRTGFVVLHPIVGVSGHPVRIEHVDGTIEEGRFPDLIDPVQPMMNIRALIHDAAPGVCVTCRMEGDTYEMEDQRNWTDASYKTYVRPLALPWPYTIGKGENVEQAVRLRVSGAAPVPSAAGAATPVAIGPVVGRMPRLGLGLDPSEIADTLAHAAPLAALGAQVLVGHYDPRRHDRTVLGEIAKAAEALGAQAWLEAVVVSVEGFADELAALGDEVARLGSPFRSVLVSPAPDLKCTLPGSVWPPAPPPRALFEAARAAFPNARLGGGMFSLFTELNRKRPPVELVDVVSFTTAATVHAGDDVSVTEGLEALPAIALSARRIAGDKPFCVGPSAIGMRMNPYGEAPFGNPGNRRQAMTFNDPRQRGILGAAWALGHVARFAEGGAETVVLGGTTGAFGLVSVPQPWPQPGFDGQGGLFPVYHVLRGLARLAGCPLRSIRASPAVEGLAAETAEGLELWVANRTGETQGLALPGPVRDVFLLDADSFAAAARDMDAATRLARPDTRETLDLGPYAVARVRLSRNDQP